MLGIPVIAQLPIGLAIGTASVLAPWALRPFIIVGATLLVMQAGLFWAAGGEAGLAMGLTAITGLAREVTLTLVGVGVGTASRLGVMQRWPSAGTYRSLARTAVRIRNRACHYRQRSEPAAGGRHRVGSSASAAPCSSGGSPGNWPSLR